MYQTIPISGLCREEWLRYRKSGIGGSDAGAICGLNPYSNPMSVYRDKTAEEIEDIDNEAMRQGRDLEDYVAHRFMEATGLKVRRSKMIYRNEEYPFMIADVDRMVLGESAGLECKTANAYNADKWKDGEIPAHYAIQCYHYMAVTGKRSWYIAVVILGVGFRYAKLTWDDEIISSLIQVEKNFWEHHVIPRVMPDPDGSEACDRVLEEYFHISRKNSKISLEGFDRKLDRRVEIGELIKKLENEQNQIDQEVKLYMGEHELAESSRYKVSWISVSTSRLDTKRIQEEQPELCKEFTKKSRFRKFSVKAA